MPALNDSSLAINSASTSCAPSYVSRVDLRRRRWPKGPGLRSGFGEYVRYWRPPSGGDHRPFANRFFSYAWLKRYRSARRTRLDRSTRIAIFRRNLSTAPASWSSASVRRLFWPSEPASASSPGRKTSTANRTSGERALQLVGQGRSKSEAIGTVALRDRVRRGDPRPKVSYNACCRYCRRLITV
jgi:hypothetical protein